MNTKLTLNLDKEIINEAKIYAKSHRVSLSKWIENYLNSLTQKSKEKSIPEIRKILKMLKFQY